MFSKISGHVNAPVIIINDQLRREKMRSAPDEILECGGFATVYRSHNLFPQMARFSICPYEFNRETRELIRRDNEFPAIMLDDRVLVWLLEEEIEAAVAHEIAHVAHGDYYKNLPLDPMHPARMIIEEEADKFSAGLMGSPQPVINMISKLRYALPGLLGSCGHKTVESHLHVKAIDARIAALHKLLD
jgi:hypothetical protein